MAGLSDIRKYNLVFYKIQMIHSKHTVSISDMAFRPAEYSYIHLWITKALVTPSYDVVRWGKILDIYDCPRLGYHITILVLWSQWQKWVCDAVRTITGT